MRRVLFVLALMLGAAAVCGQAGIDSMQVVLPGGDTTVLVLPSFPDEVHDVSGFEALWDSIFIVLVMVVGFFKDRIPVLKDIEDKELAILAFVVAAVVVVVFAQKLTGSNAWDATRIVIDATIATRVYAWGWKFAVSLWDKGKALYYSFTNKGGDDGDGQG
ncbi:MAG: hypothetical protein D6746_01100 [Bacteroidetes bacterium]|nr:MAG: hypothetical protein D6746_01100 [Bacteroidota bacterium]